MQGATRKDPTYMGQPFQDRNVREDLKGQEGKCEKVRIDTDPIQPKRQ